MKPAGSFEIPKLIVTGDGSHTLYVPSLNEHYHSHFGALTESKHIFIESGFRYCNKEAISVLEVGFGTGLNALLTAACAKKDNRKVHYVSIEKYPLPASLIMQLNYASLEGSEEEVLFRKIHEASWGGPVQITQWFTIHKVEMDLTTDSPVGKFDLIYFDAFGPDKQPEMWTHDVFERIAEASRPGTVFVTYSAKGSLKRMLRELGFQVTLLPGPPGKRVMTRAIKN